MNFRMSRTMRHAKGVSRAAHTNRTTGTDGARQNGKMHTLVLCLCAARKEHIERARECGGQNTVESYSQKFASVCLCGGRLSKARAPRAETSSRRRRAGRARHHCDRWASFPAAAATAARRRGCASGRPQRRQQQLSLRARQPTTTTRCVCVNFRR